MKRVVLVVLLSWSFDSLGLARQVPQVCGTYRDKWKEELHLHRQAVAQRGRHGPQAQSLAPAASRDAGDIVVLEDADGVVARRNPFNLGGSTITFEPSGSNAVTYHFATGSNSYDADAATNGTKLDGLADDDSRMVPLPFAFPFFGASYQRVWVNSDGNLTFVLGDQAMTERSLGRMTAGSPRIAALFRDLDPSMSAAGVRVLAEGGRFVVSWAGVPEYRDSGIGPLQTFQARLYPDGRIEFAYGDVNTDAAVVGISPGRLQGSTSLVSFVAGSSQEYSSTIAERFGNTEEVDIVVAAQKFYETHEDAYDYLVIFNNRNVQAANGAVAYEVTVRNNRSGYGDEPVNAGGEFGSRQRLQAMMNMGPLSQYPSDPNAVVPGRFLSRDTPLTVLGHEAGHLFLAYASVHDPGNPTARPMLGRQLAHWSFLFNSEASLLEGNRIRDDGEGAVPRFTTVATVEGYSPLDQYLMGFRPPEEVPPTFLVTGSDIGSGSRSPQTGVSFNGTRRDVSVNDIIDVDGRRTPDFTVAQRSFRFAFLLIVASGSQPSAADLERVDNYRRGFEAAYRRFAGDRATADTRLLLSLRVSTFPAAGILAGGTIPASVTIEHPAAAPLALAIDTQSGIISAPTSVTIPAGATIATFAVRGVRAGVDDLVVRPAAGDPYETVRSRVQVLDAMSALKLEVASGDKQAATAGAPLDSPLVFRVSDINRLPYPGLSIHVTAVGGGKVTPDSAVTDENGTAQFRWTPGPGAVNELRASVDGGPSALAAVATALGRPAIATAGVVNAASFQPGITPGGLATVFGSSLAGGAALQARAPFPSRLGNVQVLLNGQAAPLIYVSDSQINFVAPAGLAGGTAAVMVSAPNGVTATVQVPVLATQPGIFYNAANGYGAVLIAGTSQPIVDRPAAPGDVLEVYATGLGAVRASATLGLSETVARPDAYIAGTLAPVLFSGLAPGFVGLYQVNVQAPGGLSSGDQSLVIVMDGKTSNEVKVRLR